MRASVFLAHSTAGTDLSRRLFRRLCALNAASISATAAGMRRIGIICLKWVFICLNTAPLVSHQGFHPPCQDERQTLISRSIRTRAYSSIESERAVFTVLLHKLYCC